MRKFLSIAILLLLPLTGWGATYYVDPDCTDTNPASATVDGTAYNPAGPSCTGGSDSYYVTIADVNAKSFAAGDFVYFKRGETWREKLTVPSSGSAGNVITFGAYGSGEKPIITGLDVLTGFTVVSGNVYQKTSVTTEPFVVLYNGTLLKLNNGATTGVGANEWDWAANVLYVNVGEDPDVGTLEAGQRSDAVFGNNKDYITIDGLDLQGGNTASINLDTSTDYWNVKNNVIRKSKNGLYGATDAGSNNTIDGNTIRDIVEFGILWNAGTDATNETIKNNEIYSIGDKGGTESNMQGIYGVFGTGTVIENNIIHDGGDTTADHCFYLSGTGITLRYNTCRSYAGWGIKLSTSVTNTYIYYNVSYNTPGGLVIEYGNPQNIYIYNNVFANSPEGSNGQGIRVSPFTTADNIVIKNNIVYNINYTQFSDLTKYNYYIDAGVTNLTINNNLVYSPTPHASGYYAKYEDSDHTWAQWQAHGFDTSGVNSDPLFVSPGNNFHLKPGSPAINQGASVGLTRDYDGFTVPRGAAPDIGAYEWANTPLLTSPPTSTVIGLFPITFEWEGFYGSDLYQLQVDDNSDYSSPEIDITTADTTYETDADDGIKIGTTYHWRVRARK